ncbi:MAG: tetratricopeptide repeat protein [Candidatus Riflebacteria bacterium]|nr:tetratricopeptide repeat protein [Candidatus Riflebacteria bacterium]
MKNFGFFMTTQGKAFPLAMEDLQGNQINQVDRKDREFSGLSDDSLNSLCVRVSLWLFLALLSVHIMFTRCHFISTDEIRVYQQTRSLWVYGDLSTKCTDCIRGRDNRRFCTSGTGQSLLALPLFGMGRLVNLGLQESGLSQWTRFFSGRDRIIGIDQWGGEVEIFFCALLNAFLIPILGVIFFVFSIRAGVSPKTSFWSAVFFCLTTYPAGQSSGFFLHTAESLFLTWSFYLLFSDSKSPSLFSRIFAGFAASMMILCRFQSGIALPGLAIYHLVTVWLRRPENSDLKTTVKWYFIQVFPFFLMLLFGLTLVYADKIYKIGLGPDSVVEAVQRVTRSMERPLNNSLSVGLKGFLISPGLSVFLYTPLLLLFPWLFREGLSSQRVETGFIAFQFLVYLFVCSKLDAWHGMWAYGPRYLTAPVSLVMLLLPLWIERAKMSPRIIRTAVGILVFAGLLMQISSWAVNFYYVAWIEKYLDYKPMFSYLFVPSMSPILAHFRALFAWDYRVDMWLVNAFRGYGFKSMIIAAFPFLCLMFFSLYRLKIIFNCVEMQKKKLENPDFLPLFRIMVLIYCMILVFTGAIWLLDPESSFPKILANPDSTSTEQEMFMMEGFKEAFKKNNLTKALEAFKNVLKLNPYHDKAYTEAATILKALGRRKEALNYLERALDLKDRTMDIKEANQIRTQLAAWRKESH